MQRYYDFLKRVQKPVVFLHAFLFGATALWFIAAGHYAAMVYPLFLMVLAPFVLPFAFLPSSLLAGFGALAAQRGRKALSTLLVLLSWLCTASVLGLWAVVLQGRAALLGDAAPAFLWLVSATALPLVVTNLRDANDIGFTNTALMAQVATVAAGLGWWAGGLSGISFWIAFVAAMMLLVVMQLVVESRAAKS